MTTSTIQALAAAALPINDTDWGSERQMTAENALFDAVRDVLPPAEFAALEDYCLKATTEEMVAEAVRLVAAHN